MSRPIAAQHGHILRRERRANSKPSALTTHDLEQVASFSTDVSGMAEVGRGGSTPISRSDGDLYVTIRACTKHDDSDLEAHGAECSGMHHSGFLVDTVLACTDRMEQTGATRLTPLDTAGVARLAEASAPARRRSRSAVPTASASTLPRAAGGACPGDSAIVQAVSGHGDQEACHDHR